MADMTSREKLERAIEKIKNRKAGGILSEMGRQLVMSYVAGPGVAIFCMVMHGGLHLLMCRRW